MIKINKRKKESGYGFANKPESEEEKITIESQRKMEIDELFDKRGFCFGKSFSRPKEENKMFWEIETKKTLNYSIAMVGGSGSGKTRLAVHLLTHLSKCNKNVIVMDVQGDMHIEGETLYKLTRRNNDIGFNYFTFTKDKDNGGPVSNANLIIELFKNSVMERGIGPVQKAVFKQAIIDCYRSKGILEEDESTWDNELPTPEYFEKFMQNILGNSVGSKVPVFTECLSNLADFKGKEKKAGENEKEKWQKKIAEEMEKYKALNADFEEYLISNEHKAFFEGMNFDENTFDLFFYYIPSNFKALTTLYTYIKIMADCPLFGDNTFPDIRGIVRFDISSYTSYGKPEEAIFFMNFVLSMFFRAIKERGEYRFMDEEYKAKHGKYCDSFCFIDESKLVLPQGRNKENPFHILNRITTEARKYGGGVGVVSQRLSHFPEELINSIYTKIILKSEQTDIDLTIKKLGVAVAGHGDPRSLFDNIGNSQDGVAIVGTTGGLYDSLVTPWYQK